jgi:Lhr-like helicase
LLRIDLLRALAHQGRSSIAIPEVSSLSVPVMLEIGRESVYGEAHEALLAEAAADLIDDAMRLGSDTVH